MHSQLLQSCLTPCDPMIIPLTVAQQGPLSKGFPRQESWSGLLCTPPEDCPNPGIGPTSPASPALAGGFFSTSTTWEALYRLFVALDVVQSPSRVQLFWTHELQPSPSPEVCPSSCPLHWWWCPASSSSDSLFPSALNLSQHQGFF